MKTEVEVRFENVVKYGVYELLMPLGFKKKGNSFYRFSNGIGHLVNLQKSSYYSKDHIHFTLNTGIFLPEFWVEFHNHSDKPVPYFPTEADCVLRMKIGRLKGQGDLWYDITTETSEDSLIEEMENSLNGFILPHFAKAQSKDMFVEMLDQGAIVVDPLARLIVFGALGNKERAQTEFDQLLIEPESPLFLSTVNGYGKKYGLTQTFLEKK